MLGLRPGGLASHAPVIQGLNLTEVVAFPIRDAALRVGRRVGFDLHHDLAGSSHDDRVEHRSSFGWGSLLPSIQDVADRCGMMLLGERGKETHGGRCAVGEPPRVQRPCPAGLDARSRPVPESNRITRLCRPLRSRPAHWPLIFVSGLNHVSIGVRGTLGPLTAVPDRRLLLHEIPANKGVL